MIRRNLTPSMREESGEQSRSTHRRRRSEGSPGGTAGVAPLATIMVGITLAALSCGDGAVEPTTPPSPPPTPVATTVRVNPASAALTSFGETVRFTGEVRDQNGQVLSGATVAWASSDASVASVDASGLVTAVANGTATITATAGSAAGTGRVTVAQAARAVAVSPAAVELTALGDTVRLTAEALDANGHPLAGAVFEWVSSDDAVAAVDTSGLVRAVREGMATITATVGDARSTADIEVTNTQDREALAALYRATDGPEWTDSDNWLTDAPLDEWYGVRLSPAGRVFDLLLSNNGLVGRIPHEIGDLTSLLRFEVHGNRLTGQVPSSLFGTALKWLRFEQNAGLCAPGTPVFVEWLESLPNPYFGSFCNEADRTVLESLYAATGGDSWTNDDSWLGSHALGNWYGVSADSIGRVTALDLSGNGLTGRFPSDIGLLTTLAELRIGDNSLEGPLPQSLARLSLTTLHYAGTDICIPSEPSFRRWLDAVPSHDGTGLSCGGLSDRDILEILYRSTGGAEWTHHDGWLSEAPPGDWYGVETDADGRVTGLQLARNNMSGPIPPDLGGLTGLTVMDFESNGLTGPLPPELGNLTNLKVLRLWGNDFAGPIPPELGGLASLEHLSFGGKGLSGPLPPRLGELASLRELWVWSRELTGRIPPQLGNAASLRALLLWGGGLSGPIPPELGDLTNLDWLDLGTNDLSGPIPPELGNLTKLRRLYLRRNDLSGPIPPELGTLSTLEQLHLQENGLSGPIPPELGDLSSLSYLNLDWNALTGPIPPEFGSLASLTDLHFTGNDLSGPVPPEFGELVSLERLSLANNSGLSGALPSGLTALGGLERLLAVGTGLCAPTDADFAAWLQGVPERWIALCDGGSVPVVLTQATQSREFPVTLVAGEPALLRVFVTADGGAEADVPPVRAWFYLDGAEAHVVDIPTGSKAIPAEVDESDLSLSANAAIPADIVQPGLEIVIEIDPESTLDLSTLEIASRIPETGRLAVDVAAMPTFRLTVVPFLWDPKPDSLVLDITREMVQDPAHHELLGMTRTLLPVEELVLRAHEPVETSRNDAFGLHRETEAIRILEGEHGHYLGTITGEIAGIDGIAAQSGRTAFAKIDSPREGRSEYVIAHELGHNMSLRHPAGCGAGTTDELFPYANGQIGAWGYDFDTGRLVPPSEPDVMSYCGGLDRWISGYHLTKALRHRTVDEGAAASVAAAHRRALLLWGGVAGDGTPFLDPAFLVDAAAALPKTGGGGYRLTGHAEDGNELFGLSFDMPAVADGDGSSSFAFILPVQPEWEDDLVNITLAGPGGSATLDGDTDRPMAIVRDPSSGQVRGFYDLAPHMLAQGVAEVLSLDPGWEVLLSRGIPAPRE